MITRLYTFFISFYFAAIRAAAPFSSKAREWVEGRRDWKKKLEGKIDAGESWLWVHCSSLGEFEDARAVVEDIKQRHGSLKILLTFFSPSGYEVRKDYPGADHVCYLPADLPAGVNAFLDIVSPRFIIFSRNDVWPNYVIEAKRRNIPVLLLSIAMRDNSGFLKWPQRSLYQKIFPLYDHIFCQDELTNNLLSSFCSSNITVIGNTRIDRVYRASHAHLPVHQASLFCGSSFVVIAGSTLTRDREMFLQTYRSLKHLDIKWIIAPHDVSRNEIAEAQTMLGNEMITWSMIEKQGRENKLLWIDNVGMLAGLYMYSHLAFIGGGFNRIGIHSILEPAAHGNVIAFGPNHRGYTEAKEMLAAESCFIIRSAGDLTGLVLRFYNDRDACKRTGEINREYIRQRTGAAGKVISQLEEKYPGIFSKTESIAVTVNQLSQ